MARDPRREMARGAWMVVAHELLVKVQGAPRAKVAGVVEKFLEKAHGMGRPGLPPSGG